MDMTEPCGVCPYHHGLRERMESINREGELKDKALDKSIEVAKVEMDRRLETMNDIRGQLNSQAKDFAQKSKVDDLEKRVNNITIDLITRKDVEAIAKELDLKIAPLKDQINVKKGGDIWVHYLIMITISVILSMVIPRMFK